MNVHLVSVIGEETIKDCDSDYLTPETVVANYVCESREVADKIEKFVMEIDKKLRKVALKIDPPEEEDIEGH